MSIHLHKKSVPLIITDNIAKILMLPRHCYTNQDERAWYLYKVCA